MAAVDKQHQALQTIFSFFLGLMVVAFIGIGVNTFYPSPEQATQKEITKIDRQMQEIDMRAGAKGTVDLSDADRAERARLQRQLNDLQDKMQAQMEVWARNTSIILVLCATVVMVVSLYRSEQLRVVSNGLLLGGLFTMIYGAGWIIASGTSTARFYVILFALAVTVGLGYVKFVRMKKVAPEAAAEAATGVPSSEGVTALEARLAAIEARLAAAGDALSSAPRDRD